MRLNRYIHQRLTEYYSQPATAVVGATSGRGPISFGRLLGKWHWNRVYARHYREQEGQWLTPSELFKPYYSNCLAEFIASNHSNHSTRLDIVEVGGGRATNAVCILEHLKQNYQELYSNVTYSILDSSPTLLEMQRSRGIRSEYRDLMEVADGSASMFSDTAASPDRTTHTFVLALEVLDNLPHDKIRRQRDNLEYVELEHKETDPGWLYNEIYHTIPHEDHLLSSVAQAYANYNRPTWVPTTACGTLQAIANERDNVTVLAADFDWLPPQMESDGALGEPLVTDMSDIELPSYLSPSHTPTDVLFPTNFAKLARFATKYFSVANVQKQSEFLNEVSREQVALTKSWLTGYSPMVDDFSNCSIITLSKTKR